MYVTILRICYVIYIVYYEDINNNPCGVVVSLTIYDKRVEGQKVWETGMISIRLTLTCQAVG